MNDIDESSGVESARRARPRLVGSVSAWGSDSFSATLSAEIRNLPLSELPLTEATSQGGYIDDSDLEITVFHVGGDKHSIRASIGCFFTEIVICCGCGDEPMQTNGYCQMRVEIDRVSGEARFTVVSD
jgi:hypothetical protein